MAFASSGCSGLAAVSAATARALTRDHPRRKMGKPRSVYFALRSVRARTRHLALSEAAIHSASAA